MSAQGATLRRGTIHLPIWPVAVLVVAAAAVMIMTSLFDDVRPQGPVSSVSESERLANSSAWIREQGAVAPALPVIDPAVLEHSSAAIREQGAALGVGAGLSAPTYATGLENPGAYVTHAPTYATGLENPGAYQPNGITSKAEPHDPITFDGTACPQCR